MVHGAFCGGWCFDDFRRPFETAGWAVHAPDLPGHAPGARGSDVAGLSLRDYAAATVRTAAALPAPPVLVGHSLGALVAQLAAARAAVVGLVLLAPSPAWGQPMTSPGELAAGGAVLASQGLFAGQSVAPDYGVVRAYTFDRLDEARSRALYARMGPESGRALSEALNWWLDPLMAAHVPDLAGVPALVLGGGADRVHPPAAVEATAARLGAPCLILPGLSHWCLGEPGWETTAQTALGWLEGLAAAPLSDAAA